MENRVLEGIVTSRTPTWNGVGREVNANSIVDVLHQAGLDYTVDLKPVILEDGHVIDNRFATVRSDGHVYDVVSDKYNIIQNHEAFDFVDFMGSDIVFEKAGETASGMVYIIARMEDVSILGDTFIPHVIFRNGFSGKVKISAAVCPLRMVCENQFNVAFRNTANSVNIRHVMNAQQKMLEARNTMKMSVDYMRQLDVFANRYASMRFTGAQISHVVDRMFPVPSGPERKDANPFALKVMEDRRERFIAAHEHQDNNNFRGTAWGLINAYTDYMTHTEPSGKTDSRFENRFIKSVFTPNFTGDIIPVIEAA